MTLAVPAHPQGADPVAPAGAQITEHEESRRLPDPLLVTGLTMLPAAVVGVAIGGRLLTLDRATMRDLETGEEVPASLSPGHEAHGIALLSAGTTAAALGLTVAAVGAWRGSQPAMPPSGPLLTLGAWFVETGLTTAVMGTVTLVRLHEARDDRRLRAKTRDGAIVLTVMGGAMTSAGVALASYELATGPFAQYAPRNEGFVYAGIGFSTQAAVNAGIAAMICSEGVRPESPHAAGLVYCLPPLILGGLAFAGGLVFTIKGARDTPDAQRVSLEPGPLGIGLRGTLP